MAIWILVTSCLISQKYEERKREYITGISNILKFFNKPYYNIVIVENNSKLNNVASVFHKTFLDKFGIPVLYTKNNRLITKTGNRGIIEMFDIFECIRYFNIQDDDFIVKITGRYILDEDSPFVKVVDNLQIRPYSAIVRFNQYDTPPSLIKTDNCVSGIIGLKCKYVKQIKIPELTDVLTSIEMKWAEVISTLNDDEICVLEKLGLWIKPYCLFDYTYINI